MAKKVKGARGSWFAVVDGETFACVHSHWFRRGSYEDPTALPGDPKFERLAASIREKGRVILTKDEVSSTPSGQDFRRMGYVALWSVSDVALDDTGLRFRFINRLEELE